MDIFKSMTTRNYPIIVPSYFRCYHILNEIDNGSTCVTVLVENQKTEDKYAAKIISKNDIRRYNCNQSIINEAKILKSISHENIIKLYDMFEIENDDGDFFIVHIMEYCEKGDFITYLLNNTVDDADKIRIFHHVLSAVKYLHDNQISHGDIKADNIVLDSNLNPKLCDFGYARTKTTAGDESKAGTIYYAAPELHTKGIFNTLKTDIFAIGITLYTIFELQYPFKDGNENYITKQIINGDFSLRKGMNKQLVSLFKRCTELDPQKRINIDEVLNDDFFLNKSSPNKNNNSTSTNEIAH